MWMQWGWRSLRWKNYHVCTWYAWRQPGLRFGESRQLSLWDGIQVWNIPGAEQTLRGNFIFIWGQYAICSRKGLLSRSKRKCETKSLYNLSVIFLLKSNLFSSILRLDIEGSQTRVVCLFLVHRLRKRAKKQVLFCLQCICLKKAWWPLQK